MHRFFLFFVFVFQWYVYAVELREIREKPLSRARDLMIWQFLRQKNITPAQAKEAFSLVKDRSNVKIKTAYAALIDGEIRKELVCKKKRDLTQIQDDACLNYAFSLRKTAELSRFERDKLLVRAIDPKYKALLQIQNEPYSFKRYRLHNPRYVIEALTSFPIATFRRFLNREVALEDILFLTQAKNFERFVIFLVTHYELGNLQRSFFHLPTEPLSSQSAFYLALNALRHGEKSAATVYLDAALRKAKRQKQKDKITFWQYLVDGKVEFLEELLLSMDINIYTLYAHEKLDVAIVNYFHTVTTQNVASSYDLKNPFDWLRILRTVDETPRTKLFSLVSRYRYKDLAPVVRFIMEKAYEYKMHGYLSPYDSYLQDVTKRDKALIYAIMRQESNYIPSAISYSFALGLMQLMPFLVDHIAHKRHEKIDDYFTMFVPEKNIAYAKIHLRWLKKVLRDNPLFIAYAYNGGYGFFSRYRKEHRFCDAPYEPFMSMEMMQNAQTREYGKYVLANYAMYMKIYGLPFSIASFFKSVTNTSPR